MNVSGFPKTKKTNMSMLKGSGIPVIMPNNYITPNQGRAKSHFRGVTNAMDLLSNNSLGGGAISMTNSQMIETDRSSNQKRSLNFLVKKKEAERIDEENAVILKRLQKVKPT